MNAALPPQGHVDGDDREDHATQFDAIWDQHSGRTDGWHFNRDELYEERAARRRRRRITASGPGSITA